MSDLPGTKVSTWTPDELGWQRHADNVWESPTGELRKYPLGQVPIIQRLDRDDGARFTLTIGDLVRK